MSSSSRVNLSQEVLLLNLSNGLDLLIHALELSVGEELGHIVNCETNEEVVDDDGDNDNKDEEDKVDGKGLSTEGVTVLKLTNHHGNGLHEGGEVDAEIIRQENHEDEGEAKEHGDVNGEENHNFLRNLRKLC